MIAKKKRPSRAATLVTLGAVGVLVALVALIPFITNRVSAARQAREYSGIVISKTSVVSQSKYGTKLQLQLVVRTDRGDEFTTPVPPAVHSRAVVGSRIRKRAGESFPTILPER